jgi:hypothetical protein
MDVSTPPSATGLRVQELGESLIVQLRPRRMWGELVFLTVWLSFWTFGGIAALIAFMSAPWAGRAFLGVWLCGWVFGECAAVVAIAWQLFGHEIMTVTREQLEVRRAVGRFSRAKRYEVALVSDIVAAPVPTDSDEKPRKDFSLQFSYGDETVSVGEGLDKHEAEQLASLVAARIRPRGWWGEEEPAVVYTASSEQHVEPPRPGRPWRVLALMAAGLTVLFAIAVIRDAHAPSPRRAAPAPSAPQGLVPPSQDPYAAARTLASATTASMLRAGRTTILGMPMCKGNASWTSWRCTVRAQATIGPFAGRTMRYYCDSRHVCGPVRPQGWNSSTSS